MSNQESFSAIGEYFGELTKLMEQAENSKQIAQLIAKNIGSEYSLGILMSLAEIDSLHKEISQILEDFSGKQIGFSRAIAIDHLVLLVKFYVIEWSTMIDMIASLINKVFNIGISDKDVRLGLLLRNKHVQKSDMKAIIGRHSKAIDYDSFKQLRNEIVHRNRIIDTEIVDLHKERNRLLSQRYSLLTEPSITEEDYEIKNAALHKKVTQIARQKQAHYRTQYDNTLRMISETLRALARKTLELYERDAI